MSSRSRSVGVVDYYHAQEQRTRREHAKRLGTRGQRQQLKALARVVTVTGRRTTVDGSSLVATRKQKRSERRRRTKVTVTPTCGRYAVAGGTAPVCPFVVIRESSAASTTGRAGTAKTPYNLKIILIIEHYYILPVVITFQFLFRF